ncbi:MAG: hypothetical protein ACLFPQ_03545 [Candidatus Woesearchaeota archaeon]
MTGINFQRMENSHYLLKVRSVYSSIFHGHELYPNRINQREEASKIDEVIAKRTLELSQKVNPVSRVAIIGPRKVDLHEEGPVIGYDSSGKPSDDIDEPGTLVDFLI